MAVCSVAQENGACATLSILTGRTKLQFSSICRPMIPNLNGTQFRCHIPNLKNSFNHSQDTSNQTLHFFSFLFFFSHTRQNHCNLQMCSLIWLKFETFFQDPKANLSIKFEVNLINIPAIFHIKQSQIFVTPIG